MNIAIIKSSPRPEGNTNTLLSYLIEELKENINISYTVTDLSKLEIQGCTACRICQQNPSSFGCRIKDGMEIVSKRILDSDLILLATPIYSWYCTSDMKAMLDRLVYGMNKYYGETKGSSLWQGKKLALLLTCGYPIENGTGLFEEGIKRYCRHSGLIYLGKTAARHLGYDTVFLTDEKIQEAKVFGRYLCQC